MLVLVSSTNFIQLFLGWEGIGLCSYFLIGFWYTRIQANKSALKAIIVNRVGDIALLIAISGIVFLSNTTDFDTIFVFLPFYATKILYIVGFEINFIEFICFWLMVAAIGKSAQIGLHT
jgi:NADH-quinone oxidoreductase subunit L